MTFQGCRGSPRNSLVVLSHDERTSCSGKICDQIPEDTPLDEPQTIYAVCNRQCMHKQLAGAVTSKAPGLHRATATPLKHQCRGTCVHRSCRCSGGLGHVALIWSGGTCRLSRTFE